MRNAKGITHTGFVRGAVYNNDKVHVLFFTGMSEEDLFDLKVDMGKRWLITYLKQRDFTEEEASDMWEMYKELRQLWNNEWRRMDHYLIVPILHKLQPGECENVYRDLHLNVFTENDPYRLWLEIGMMQALKKMLAL